MSTQGTIGPVILNGYTVEAYGKFIAVGNPHPKYASQTGTGSIEVYRYDGSLGNYSHYGLIESLKATGTGTSGTSAATTKDGYGLSMGLYNDILVVGDPYFAGTYTGTPDFKNSVDIFKFTSSFDSSIIEKTLYSVAKISEPGSNINFGGTVSINKNYIVVGANKTSTNKGSVYVYSYTTGSGTVSCTLKQEISEGTVGKYFGSVVKIDQSGTDSILISESSSLSNPKVFLYESSSVGWVKTHTFTSITGSKNLPFDNLESYDYVKNSADQFGRSIQINGDTIVIGAPYDSTYYEYQGSLTNYPKGAVYIYGRTDCPANYTNTTSIYYNESASYWDLQEKYIGDENTIKGNRLGHAVDVYDNMILIGCPSSSNPYPQSSISASINKTYDDVNIINGQYILLERTGSNVSFVTYDNKKKEYKYPYMSYGYDVAASEMAIVIGSPMILSDSSPDAAYIVNDLTNGQIDLYNINGHAYISTWDSLRSNYHVGNVFYKNGDIIFSNDGSKFENALNTNDTHKYKYDVDYMGRYTIHEKSIICTVSPGEFNVSTNITALDTTVPTFDLNGDNLCDFRDINLILLYIVDINTSGSVDFSTNDTVWDSYVIENDTERSLFDYYEETFFSGNNSLRVSYPQHLSNLIALESQFDVDGDGSVTINDAKIIWKYFVHTLDIDSYQRLKNPFSTRTTFTDIIGYLTSKMSRYSESNGVPYSLPEFANYNYSASMDVTGSFLAPYITTVGLYSNTDLVAVAKLSTPIKNSGEYPLNFLIKWDM